MKPEAKAPICDVIPLEMPIYEDLCTTPYWQIRKQFKKDYVEKLNVPFNVKSEWLESFNKLIWKCLNLLHDRLYLDSQYLHQIMDEWTFSPVIIFDINEKWYFDDVLKNILKSISRNWKY